MNVVTGCAESVSANDHGGEGSLTVGENENGGGCGSGSGVCGAEIDGRDVRQQPTGYSAGGII